MKQFVKILSHSLALVFTAPLFLLYNCTKSHALFAGQAQLLALIPGKIGSYLRIAFYSRTLTRCPLHGYIGFGSFFAHPDAEMGMGCYIGAYTIIGRAIIGNHATIASHVSILSGKNQHGYQVVGQPIQEQTGIFTKITIGENSWIGNNSVVMANLGFQTIVAAGSVVVSETEACVVVGGNPARKLKSLSEPTGAVA